MTAWQAEQKKQQEKMKEFLGNENCDYNIVMPSPNGRPMEEQAVTR